MIKRVLIACLPLVGASLGVAVLLATLSQPCLACGSQTPPMPCGVNLSAMTLKQGDDRAAWWDALSPRDDRVIHVYLGLNNNQGSSTSGYTYNISCGGDWDPGVAGVVTPTVGSGELGPAGSQRANETIEISVPYSTTQIGDLVITATVQSTDGLCIFRQPVTTTVRINEEGPTVWAVTPRTCPKAGAKPQLTFGIRNPNDETETYSVVARSYNPMGGTASDQFNLNGQDAVATLEPLTIRPGQSKKVKIDCETFGYCLTGGENQVRLEVSPTTNEELKAVAWSNVTIRDPESVCPEIEDWWFFMPPALAAVLIGVPSAIAALGGGAYVARTRKPKIPPPTRPNVPKVQAPEREPKPPASTGEDVTHGRPKPPPGPGSKPQ